MIFLFLVSSFSFKLFKQKVNQAETESSSFSFITSRNKRFTLLKNHNKSEKNFLSNKLLKSNKNGPSKNQWYYVHIFSNQIAQVQQYLTLHPKDEIIKHTYLLYLSPNQVEQISPFVHIKSVDPRDKIDEISRLNETDYFYVKTAASTQLPTNPKLYTIERQNGPDTYIVKIEKDELNSTEFLMKKLEAEKYLSSLAHVKTVTTYKKPVQANNIHVGYIQNNLKGLIRDPSSFLYDYKRYVHEHGITGEGELITIEDTSIDFRHPMFRDDETEVEFNKEMPNHRKIFYYKSDESIDEWKAKIKEDEHGTHTAGTAAGKSIIRDGIGPLFDGSAPDAKIIYPGVYGNVTGIELEEIMNAHNSRISSNSWGDDDIYVDNLNHEYGTVAQRNPQSLFVFASGNRGIYGNFSVLDPGGNKNLLSVGYTSNIVFPSEHFYMIQSVDNPSFYTNCRAEFIEGFVSEFEFIGTDKSESDCIALNASQDVCSKINGSHITILYEDNFDKIYSLLDYCFYEYSKGLLITDNITAIRHFLDSREKVRIIFNTEIKELNPITKGLYSSTGPGNKGIIKPDVVAPGSFIISAKSYPEKEGSDYQCNDVDKGCGLTMKSGSSMATPNVAGAAALISQYFKTGKWIDKVELDGSTLRALIINSCRHPHGSKSPDIIFGHGMVDISTVLPFDESFGVQITPQEEIPSVYDHGHVSAKIDVRSNSQDLQVTLSYLDLMLNENSPVPLTRDLDLVVVSPDGRIFTGDHLDHNDTQHFSTNEKIIIRKDEVVKGSYTVHVFGYSFVDSLTIDKNLRQNFSVVATGDIENKYIKFTESSESPCSKSDPENPGFCLCNENEIGPVCQMKIQNVSDEEGLFNVTLKPFQIHRIKISSKNKIIKSVSIYYEFFRNAPTIWLSPTCHLSLADYDINGNVGLYEPLETNVTFGTSEICLAIFSNCEQEVTYYVEAYSEEENNDDGNNNNNKKDKKIISVIIALIVVFSIAFVVLICVVVYIIIKGRKEERTKVVENNLLQSENLF